LCFIMTSHSTRKFGGTKQRNSHIHAKT